MPIEITSLTQIADDKVNVEFTLDWKYLYNESRFEDDWVEGYSAEDGSQSKEGDHLFLHVTSGSPMSPGERTYVIDDEIDLTNYDEIKINWENTGTDSTNNESYLVVSANKDGDHETGVEGSIAKTNSFSRTTDTLDISGSGFDGSFYIRIHAVNTGTTRARILAYKVYLK